MATETIRILSDSSCDLSLKQIEENGIIIVPHTLILGERVVKDGYGVTAESVLEFVRSENKLPKTSATTQAEYYAVFKKYLGKGENVIHFNISSATSGSYNYASLAKEQLENEGFGNKIHVVDTLALSTGYGLQIMKTIDYIKSGSSFAEIVEKLKELPEKVQTSFVIDKLEFLHKGGRCSLLSLMSATVLKVHPYISMRNGKLSVKKKYVGSMSRCLTCYIKDLSEEYKNYDKTRCFITHSPSDKKLVELCINLTKELFDFNEIIETEAGSTVTAHCGENTIGLLFIKE